jgi:hypothetical protein
MMMMPWGKQFAGFGLIPIYAAPQEHGEKRRRENTAGII